MKPLLLALGLTLGLGTLHAHAAPVGPAANALGSCLTDSLTGKERKDLARWIFFSMATHPEIAQYANVSAPQREQSNQEIGTLITRLLTKDCPAPVRAAVQENGAAALKFAFEVAGAAAMQELMGNPDVVAGMAGFERYMDQQKLRDLLTQPAKP